jgi:hypothetical protein
MLGFPQRSLGKECERSTFLYTGTSPFRLKLGCLRKTPQLAVLQEHGPSRQQLNLVYSTTLTQGQNPFRLKLGCVCTTSYLVVLQGQGPSRQQLNLMCSTTLTQGQNPFRLKLGFVCITIRGHFE